MNLLFNHYNLILNNYPREIKTLNLLLLTDLIYNYLNNPIQHYINLLPHYNILLLNQILIQTHIFQLLIFLF